MAHASDKVAVGRGHGALPLGEHAHVAAQARPAGGGGHGAAGLDERADEPVLHRAQVDLLRGGDDDRAHMLCHMPPLEHGGGSGQVAVLPVGARADDRLVDAHVPHLADGAGVLRQVREGDRQRHFGQVDLDRALIGRAVVGAVDGGRARAAARQVRKRLLVRLEDAVLGARLDGHVGDGQPVKDRQRRHARPGELHRAVQRAVHADQADDVQDHVLAAHIRAQAAAEAEADGARHLEPRLARGHGAGHIRGANARGKRAERAVGACVRIRADDHVARVDQPLFRQQRVLDAHLPHVVEMLHAVRGAELPAHLALRGGLDVLVRYEMVHDHGDAALIEHLLHAEALELADGHGRGDVVAEHPVHIRQDELPGLHRVHMRVRGEDLLRHRHWLCHAKNLLTGGGSRDGGWGSRYG